MERLFQAATSVMYEKGHIVRMVEMDIELMTADGVARQAVLGAAVEMPELDLVAAEEGKLCRPAGMVVLVVRRCR